MKMAKASNADIKMAMDLVNVLEDIERGYFPFPSKLKKGPDDEGSEFIDTDDTDQYERLVTGLRDLLDQGSISRVIWGMAVVCDQSNELIDPNADTLEHHPQRQKIEKDRDEMLAMLKSFGHKSGCRKNAFRDECTCGKDDLIARVQGG